MHLIETVMVLGANLRCLNYNHSMTELTQVGNIDQRMEMLEQHLKSCFRHFHDPIAFMTQVDSMIQSLRNFTLTVQVNKKQIPNFDAWYGAWQERMKTDEYLHWLHNKRTDIVHKDVLTTESHAVLTLNPDHLITLQTIHFDIMATSEEMIKEGVKRAEEHPEFRHSTGEIDRYYLVDVNGQIADIVHVLVAAFAFMKTLHKDLARHLKGEKVLSGKIPPLREHLQSAVGDLTITYKLKDGSVLSEKVVTMNRDNSVEAMDAARDRYGDMKLRYNVNSRSYKERTRAQYEITEILFNKDGYLLPVIHYHTKKGWEIVSPVVTDRSEKILFWRRFADKVISEEIDRFLFASEAWVYGDLKKGLRHINAGKEIKTLRNKKEVVDVYYADNKGKFFIISAPIIRDGETVKLGTAKEREEEHANMPMFASVFAAWGFVEIREATN